ncbi:heme-binding protein [Mucilaginibacter hurinus]|uniref:Heme-binding protein n=1 Tax=Mucilaginibacter hurinus TaxID=2201324 RepID=A0A367GSR9_9SPHI|nr:c-type cytochrome [Mucilaginibacter hurinus]RCH55886.1 heme-binding protein [Mucilaginibacter hurinus]
MIKLIISLLFSVVLLWNTPRAPRGHQTDPGIPPGLTLTRFAGPNVTPSPACLAVAPTGEVFVGVDMAGSLGKETGKGRIIKLIDSNNDGKADDHTVFAEVDNPRGIALRGDEVFVLHTVFSPQTKLATGMSLVVFEDKNGDNLADGPPKVLVENIGNAKYIQERGTDHATNGIRFGIDGWIYISVGDFGFVNATGTDGKQLTMFGGGIVRVRPDGTELETFTHGTRNVYDAAIDPLMNIFTRENTNDGGGWNVRFSHHIQSGEYGYPLLFKHFTDEIIPALADLGGGSGTGALFLDEPAWPKQYNKVPMMADWGRNMLYIHRITANGASFTQRDEEFLKVQQITDLDVDGSGRLYISAWDDAGYEGSADKGYVTRVVPQNWAYKPFPNLAKASVKQLAGMLKSASAVARLNASQQMLKRPAHEGTQAALSVATNQKLALACRVAGIFTYAQITGSDGIPQLVKLAEDKTLKEFALKALADRKSFLNKVPAKLFVDALTDTDARVKAAAIIGLGRIGKLETAPVLLQLKVATPVQDDTLFTIEGPHAKPSPDIILPHLVVKALVNMQAVDACAAAIGTANNRLALWALRYMHDERAVNGLIAAYRGTNDAKLKARIVATLSRLYKQEKPYDGSLWWGTRPDAYGPYYNSITWSGSPVIEKFLKAEWEKADAAGKKNFTILNTRHGMEIAEFGVEENLVASNETKVDLEEIKNRQGQVGKSSIEDVLLAIAKIEGNADEGKKLFTRQGCVACHALSSAEKQKGPFMGQIGAIMKSSQIAESILKPDASISQGFATVLITAKAGKTYMGFVTEQNAAKVVLRNIAGEVFTIKTGDIISRKEMQTSMMPAGLANSLSYQELASLVKFLAMQK